MIRRPSLNDRIQSLASLQEVEGYLLGIAVAGREMFDIEAQLLERRVDSLAASQSHGERAGEPSRPSLDPRALKVKIGALRGGNRARGQNVG